MSIQCDWHLEGRCWFVTRITKNWHHRKVKVRQKRTSTFLVVPQSSSFSSLEILPCSPALTNHGLDRRCKRCVECGCKDSFKALGNLWKSRLVFNYWSLPVSWKVVQEIVKIVDVLLDRLLCVRCRRCCFIPDRKWEHDFKSHLF